MKARQAATEDVVSELDLHVRRMVKRHFDPETGAPYWIARARRHGIDPVAELTGYRHLAKLGPLDAEELRTIPVEDFVPRSRLEYATRAPRVFETGGSSGPPKRVIDSGHQEENARWVCSVLAQHGFEAHGKWLNLFPSGPHAVSLFTYSIARARNELCYFVDIDPRWVKRLIKDQREADLDAYVAHVIDQALTVLRTQDVRYLFATPKLLERLMAATDLADTGLAGIVCGGTQITREFYRYVKEEALPHVDFCALYGNTLMGVAPQVPHRFTSAGADPLSVHYYGHFPWFLVEIVDPADGTIVPYGRRGRVRIVVLNEDVFIPSLLERDTGVRIPPCSLFSWDGVADVGAYAHDHGHVIEGVY